MLATETGELHPPKDPDRREIALTPALEAALRQTVLTDVRAMAEAGGGCRYSQLGGCRH